MISQDNIKKPFFNEQIVEIFDSTASNIFKVQKYRASTFLARRTGELIQSTSGRNFSVVASSQRVNLIMMFISKIRFLDLRKTATGKQKKTYIPIYNKVLYGFLYSRTYPRLRYGLTENIRENFTGTLRAGLNAKV